MLYAVVMEQIVPAEQESAGVLCASAAATGISPLGPHSSSLIIGKD